MEEKRGDAFTVRDRRIFSQDSPIREETSQKVAEEKKAVEMEESSGQQKQAHGPLSAPDFSSFILSLATSAQVSLGVLPNPNTGKTTRDLSAARQMIDIIAMLKEKTKGNISTEEAALMEEILYSLRMLYIKSAEAST